MRLRRRFLGRVALLSVMTLAACSTSIRDLNLRPDKHYQQKVSVTGRIMREQVVGSDMLIEIADTADNRLLVRLSSPFDVTVGDWVKVTGVLVPETRVGDSVVYDVLTVEEISHTSGPWLPNLM